MSPTSILELYELNYFLLLTALLVVKYWLARL